MPVFWRLMWSENATYCLHWIKSKAWESSPLSIFNFFSFSFPIPPPGKLMPEERRKSLPFYLRSLPLPPFPQTILFRRSCYVPFVKKSWLMQSLFPAVETVTVTSVSVTAMFANSKHHTWSSDSRKIITFLCYQLCLMLKYTPNRKGLFL